MDAARTSARTGASARPAAATSGVRSVADASSRRPEHPVSDRTHLRGQVSSFRSRNELMGSAYGTVWNFSVQAWDASGRPEPTVAVEVRGRTIHGSVGDGDWVEIPGRWRAGRLRRTSRLFNTSMNSEVVARAGGGGKVGRGVRGVVKAVVTLAVLGVAAAIAYQVLAASQVLDGWP